MARVFDFNALEQPTLEVTLKDEAKTKVRLTIPNTGVVERFMAMSAEVSRLAQNPNGELVHAVFKQWAEIFSSNADGLTFTAESLRDKYKIELVHLICFQPAYLDFIAELQNAKN
jgi:hypothetical protein